MARPSTRSPLSAKPERKVAVIDFSNQPIAEAFVQAVIGGRGREIAVFGARGDGKTTAALTAMIGHAYAHEQAGHVLPVRWVGVADTFRSHELKTHMTMQSALWQSGWRLTDGGRVAIFCAGEPPRPLVYLDLFGIEDQGAIDKLRLETVGLWFEEPAPAAVLAQSSGISETAWLTGLTSQRLPSHCHPAIITANYPDEDHWSWTRFCPGGERMGQHPNNPTRLWFRIPPGERASGEQRKEWAEALKDRPDLLRRLLEGQPGTIMLGEQVAQGFNRDLHVSGQRVRPIKDEPLILGQDFGHTPATVIGQYVRGKKRVCAALPCERGGIRQHIDNSLKPWLSAHAPWAVKDTSLLHFWYDPSGETAEQANIEENPLGVLEETFPMAWFEHGLDRARWPVRKEVLMAVFNQHVSPTVLALEIDPIDAESLIKALNGRWFYARTTTGELRRDMPKKPNHPWEDLGDAFVDFLVGCGEARQERKPAVIETAFNPTIPVRDYAVWEPGVESDFKVF